MGSKHSSSYSANSFSISTMAARSRRLSEDMDEKSKNLKLFSPKVSSALRTIRKDLKRQLSYG